MVSGEVTGGGGMRIGGRYAIETKIGEGGMGAVYRARDTKTGRVVAVKLLLEADDKSLARFRREAQASATLRHPHIVDLLDFDIDDPNGAWLVMELVDGISLATLLSREPRLPPARAIGIARQLFSALAHAHAAGILHRDVKPGNILVSATELVPEYVRLVDFGLAKHAVRDQNRAEVTTVAGMLGTPAFMPPEQMTGDALDPRADLYAAGLVLYRMLAGADPYAVTGGDRIAAVMRRERGRPLASLVPDTSPALAALVDACIAPEKAERPASAAEIALHLERMSAGGGSASLATWVPAALPDRSAKAAAPPREAPPVATKGAPPTSSRALVIVIALMAPFVVAAIAGGALLVEHRLAKTGDDGGLPTMVVAAAEGGAANDGATEAAAASSSSSAAPVTPTRDASSPLATAAAAVKNGCICIGRSEVDNSTSGLCHPHVKVSAGPSCGCRSDEILCFVPVVGASTTSAGTCAERARAFPAGTKTGDACVGFQTNGQQVTGKVISCSHCSVESLYPRTPGASCSGVFPVTGEHIVGRIECR